MFYCLDIYQSLDRIWIWINIADFDILGWACCLHILIHIHLKTLVVPSPLSCHFLGGPLLGSALLTERSIKASHVQSLADMVAGPGHQTSRHFRWCEGHLTAAMRFNCLKQLKHGKRVQAWLAQGVFVRWSKSSSNVNEHSSCACHSGCSMANASQLVALCFHLTLVANLLNGALLKTTALLFISHNHFRKCLPFRHSVFLVETKNWKRLMWSPWQKWLLVGVNWCHWAFILTLVANLSDGGLLKTIAFLCISHNHFSNAFLSDTLSFW